MQKLNSTIFFQADDAALMEKQVQKLNLTNTHMGQAILAKKAAAAKANTPRRMHRLGAVRREVEQQAQASEDLLYGSGTSLGSASTGNLTPTLSNKKDVFSHSRIRIVIRIAGICLMLLFRNVHLY